MQTTLLAESQPRSNTVMPGGSGAVGNAVMGAVGRAMATASAYRTAGLRGASKTRDGLVALARVQAVGLRNSRRKILPTLVLGRSSRNSMYFGHL